MLSDFDDIDTFHMAINNENNKKLNTTNMADLGHANHPPPL